MGLTTRLTVSLSHLELRQTNSSPLGYPLSMDMDNKTRPSMAKVRVEIDLTKPKLVSVWVGLEHESHPLKGYTQKLEYKNVPKFCRHCKLLGHSIIQCRNAEKNKSA